MSSPKKKENPEVRAMSNRIYNEFELATFQGRSKDAEQLHREYLEIMDKLGVAQASDLIAYATSETIDELRELVTAITDRTPHSKAWLSKRIGMASTFLIDVMEDRRKLREDQANAALGGLRQFIAEQGIDIDAPTRAEMVKKVFTEIALEIDVTYSRLSNIFTGTSTSDIHKAAEQGRSISAEYYEAGMSRLYDWMNRNPISKQYIHILPQ